MKLSKITSIIILLLGITATGHAKTWQESSPFEKLAATDMSKLQSGAIFELIQSVQKLSSLKFAATASFSGTKAEYDKLLSGVTYSECGASDSKVWMEIDGYELIKLAQVRRTLGVVTQLVPQFHSLCALKPATTGTDIKQLFANDPSSNLDDNAKGILKWALERAIFATEVDGFVQINQPLSDAEKMILSVRTEAGNISTFGPVYLDTLMYMTTLDKVDVIELSRKLSPEGAITIVSGKEVLNTGISISQIDWSLMTEPLMCLDGELCDTLCVSAAQMCLEF